MNRLTTDTPNGNFETMMNFAYAKNGEVWLRGADDGQDAELCAYIAKRAFYLELCGITNKDDVIEACGAADCFCELGALFAAATQAAELRARLAAYEDTGLEPEKVRGIKTAYDEVQIPYEVVATGADAARVIRLLDADDEGRLLVLPCKVGDTVYLPATDDWGDILSYEVVEMGIDRDGPYFVINDEDHDHTPMEELGKSVFLTREDAEKALEGMKNEL